MDLLRSVPRGLAVGTAVGGKHPAGNRAKAHYFIYGVDIPTLCSENSGKRSTFHRGSGPEPKDLDPVIELGPSSPR